MRRLLILVLLCAPAFATNAPVIFWSDLLDGPNSGNSDTTCSATGGAYVTLYGNYFDNVSSVTLNGTSLPICQAPSPYLWYEQMTVKIPTTATSGNWGMTTPGGSWPWPGISNTINNVLSGITVDFTVRSGSIFYVKTTGNDGTNCSSGGTFSSPWLTMPCAVQSAQPPDGRIIYVGAGVNQTTDDGQGGWGALTFREEWSKASAGGFASALLVYPGTTGQTIGSSSAGFTETGLAGTDCGATNGAAQGYWTIEGFTILTGSTSAQGHAALAFNGNSTLPIGPSCSGGTSGATTGSKHWRLVGNTLGAPLLGGQTAVIHTAYLSPCGGNVCNWILGNTVTGGANVTGGPDDQFHGIYYGDNTTGLQLGWNDIHSIVGCNGIQGYSNYDNEFSIVINDNLIHDTTCAGILVATYDPSRGEVLAYNNVLYNNGKGPQNTSEQGGEFSGMVAPRTRQSGSAGSGTAYFFHNTVLNPMAATNIVYNTCDGTTTTYGFADVSGTGGVNNTNLYLQNNIAYSSLKNHPCDGTLSQVLGTPYYLNTTSGGTMSGTNNLAFGNGCGSGGSGAAPSCTVLSGMVTSNPSFVSTVTPDLHLSSSGSSANGAGTATGLTGNVPAIALTYDHDGVIRPSPPAIGAYEFAAGTIASPTPAPSRLFANGTMISEGNYEKSNTDRNNPDLYATRDACRTDHQPFFCAGAGR